jgi:hypothetical protein
LMAFYFGKLPPYINLTLQSMGGNPGTDWIIFTDQEIGPLPSNVTAHHYTFESFRDLVKDRLGLPIEVPRPYKLADTRPAFGHIFADMLTRYDFWGCCDLDVIFGHFPTFLTAEVTEANDKLLHRGALSLYRNTPEDCQWYLTEGHGMSFKEAMSKPSIQYWDEWVGIIPITRGLGVPTWDGDPATLDICAKSYFPMANNHKVRGSRFYWDRGHLFEEQPGGQVREALYMHLQKRPMRAPYDINLNAERFYIYGNRFSTCRESVATLSDAVGFVHFHRSRLDKSLRQ